MRWSDLYMGLLAAVAGFGALVAKLEGASWYVVSVFIVAGAMALLVMAARTVRNPRVLLVGNTSEGSVIRLHDALDEAGFGVRWCAGPAINDCPVYKGQACPFADHLTSVVIWKPASYSGAAPPCGKSLHIPAVTVQDGSRHEAFFGKRSAYVGADDGPTVVARTVSRFVRRTTQR